MIVSALAASATSNSEISKGILIHIALLPDQYCLFVVLPVSGILPGVYQTIKSNAPPYKKRGAIAITQYPWD